MTTDTETRAAGRGINTPSVAALAAKADAHAEWLKAMAGAVGANTVINAPADAASYVKWLQTRVAQLTDDNKRLDRELRRFRAVAKSAVYIQSELIAD